MRRITLMIAMAVYATSFTVAQSRHFPTLNQQPSEPPVADSQIAELPPGKRGVRPQLTLQQALKLAESYVEKEKIDISSYFLREVRMIQYGKENDVKEPRWFFWWMNESGAIGDYVEITVSMEGKVSRIPSM